MVGRLQCKVCLAPKMGRIEGAFETKFKKKIEGEHKLWLKVNYRMLVEDKEKIELHNYFLIVAVIAAFLSFLYYCHSPKSIISRLELLDTKVKKENAALAM